MAVYREKLMEDAAILEKTVFSDSIRKLEAEYRKAGNREAVRQVFAELFGEWGRRFREEAASLGICYLHGSILMRTGELRLTLYGREFYLDSSRLEKAWYPPAFFRQYEHETIPVPICLLYQVSLFITGNDHMSNFFRIFLHNPVCPDTFRAIAGTGKGYQHCFRLSFDHFLRVCHNIRCGH